MERMTNADFHKFLNEFSEAVAKGKYRKMPYDKYRTFRNFKSPYVDVVLDSYTNLNGQIATRIRISPDGPTGYEFYIDDGSFGNFCYDYLKKKEEPKVHPDEKKIQYDIFGKVIEDNCASYAIASDDVYKQALNDYYTDKALKQSTADCATSISSAQNNSTVTIAGYPITGEIGIGTLADKADIRLMTDVLQEDVDALGEKIYDIDRKYQDRCDTIEDVAYVAQDKIQHLASRVEELAELVCRKTDIDMTYTVESDILSKIDELAWCVDNHEGEIDSLRQEIEAGKKKKEWELPYIDISTRSTSSSYYPVKNYKINIADCDNDNRKEKENMDTSKMFNFDFGPVASHIRMSPYGLAMKNADGKYVSYDKASGNIMDVEIFNFDAQKFLYKMPVAVNAVAVGDIVVHMCKAMFVSAVNGNRISVVDIYNGEVKDIMPTTSPFGFNFITKVVSLIDMTGATAETPFGNMLPLLMLGEGKDFKDILPLMLMTGNTGMFGNMAQNPLMLYALLKDSDNGVGDVLPFLMIGNSFLSGQGSASNCNCNCHNGENNQ